MIKRSHRDDLGGPSGHSLERLRPGLVVASIGLATGAVGSWFGLVRARDHGEYGALFWFGFLVLALAVGSILCLAVPLARQIKSGPAEPGRIKKFSAPLGDYVAQYSSQNKVVAVVLVLFWGCVTLLLFLRSRRTIGTLVPPALGVASLWYAAHVIGTSIRFTNERIIAHLPLFRTVSKPYTAIQRLQSKPGTIRIYFSDGCSVKLHSGLGDPDLVIGYLKAHCPESIEMEDSLRPLR